MELKQTPLYQRHIDNHGKMVDFAGWSLPIEYTSMLSEAKAARYSCGMFDASHMGQIEIRGRGSLAFLQYLVSNDITSMQKGQLQYNFLLNEAGGIIDDLMIYHQGNSYLCVVNASNKDKVYTWFSARQDNSVQVIDRSDETSLLSVQGPKMEVLMRKITAARIDQLKYMHFFEIDFQGCSMLVSRSGYTGEDGVEIYLKPERACFLWDRLMDIGRPYGLTLCGLGARDILRIEAGYPLYGADIDEQTNPYEASLGWAVKLDKECIAKKALLNAHQQQSRKRVGFCMEERAVPRHGYKVYADNKKVVGFVCSGTFSPNADRFIGMAYVENNFAVTDSDIYIEVRQKLYKAKIVKMPFIKTTTKKELPRDTVKKRTI